MPEFQAKALAGWSRGHWRGKSPGSIRGVSIDTRTLQPGDLYIAIRGEHFDGHSFIHQAFERGASAAMVTESFTGLNDATVALLVVGDTRRALLDIAQGYRGTLSLSAIAVTGSVGKTTVKEIIADALALKAPTARSRGNWNNDIGLPLSLLAVESGDRFAVMELGMNHPGELDPLCRLLNPMCGVVTTVGPVHLEYFNSVKDIAREKAAVLRALPPDGMAVLSRDDEWFDLLRSEVSGKVTTVSLRGDADYMARIIGTARFTVREKSSAKEMEFDAPIPGDFIVHDALLAIAVARHFGVGWEELAQAVRDFKPLPLRWQIERVHGVEFVNDAYNANPLSMRAALRAFAETPVTGRKWLVLAGMRELGSSERGEHLALGAEVAKGPWAGLLVVGRAGALIADGAEAAGMPSRVMARCGTALDAAKILHDCLAKRDAVLLKASRGEHVEDVLKEWTRLRKEENAGCTCS